MEQSRRLRPEVLAPHIQLINIRQKRLRSNRVRPEPSGCGGLRFSRVLHWLRPGAARRSNRLVLLNQMRFRRNCVRQQGPSGIVTDSCLKDSVSLETVSPQPPRRRAERVPARRALSSLRWLRVLPGTSADLCLPHTLPAAGNTFCIFR